MGEQAASKNGPVASGPLLRSCTGLAVRLMEGCSRLWGDRSPRFAPGLWVGGSQGAALMPSSLSPHQHRRPQHLCLCPMVSHGGDSMAGTVCMALTAGNRHVLPMHACVHSCPGEGKAGPGDLPARPRWRSHTYRTRRCPEAPQGRSPLRKTAAKKRKPQKQVLQGPRAAVRAEAGALGSPVPQGQCH